MPLALVRGLWEGSRDCWTFFGGETYSEDGARCYGVSGQIEDIMLFKKFYFLVVNRCQFAVFLSDVSRC